MEATIIVSAREVVATLMRVLTSPAGLLFVRRSAVVLVAPDARARVSARHYRLANTAAGRHQQAVVTAPRHDCAR